MQWRPASQRKSVDPLGFHDDRPYSHRLEASRLKTGLRDALVWGVGTIAGHRVAIGIFDFRFMGGSMGSVVGEKLARCFEAALVERILAMSKSCLAPDGLFLQYQYSLSQRAALERCFGDVRVGFTLANIPPAFVYECSLAR